ncbi:MAG: class C sortase, partial [Streptococcaceae bacterium]|nr:class C sortase [Streptococcaceae bacterium]
MKNKSKMQLFLQILILLFGSATLLTFTYPILSEALNEIWNQNILAEFNKEQQSVQEMRKDWEKLNESQKNMALKDPYSEESLIASRGGTYPNPYYVKKMIGEIYLPTIHQMLPIFNETNDHLLQKGAGLAPGSDFVGDGKGSLILLAGHSGIPSANLFNDVPKLKKGELFFLYISQKYYAYKINTIVKVLPNEVKHLRKDPSKELTTLITCLPVGINTHRLLVTGERIPFTPEMKAKLGDLK